MSNTIRCCLLFVLTVVVTAPLGGCETTVDPILGTEKAFSLYGVLRPASDTQWVRVYPVKERLSPTPPESLEATVTSTDLNGGQTWTWSDSLIQEEDGRFAHVFWTPNRVEYDDAYRLEVAGDQGQTARVEVPVPQWSGLSLQEPEAETSPVVVPVRVTEDVPRLINLEVEYYFQYDFPENVPDDEQPAVRFAISYDDSQQQVEGGWVIPIDLTADYRTLRERLVNLDLWNPELGIVMRNMTLRVEVVNHAWNPPGGEFDPDVLVEPGVMSNVEGGFGFLGAGYRLKKQWRPDDDVLRMAGWTDPSELY